MESLAYDALARVVFAEMVAMNSPLICRKAAWTLTHGVATTHAFLFGVLNQMSHVLHLGMLALLVD